MTTSRHRGPRSGVAPSLLFCLCFCLVGCASGPAVTRPLDEDLLALLPSDGELVLDVELAQLRSWHLGQAVKDLVYQRLPIPAPLRDRLWDAELVAVSIHGLGDWRTARVVAVVKGDPPLPPPPPEAVGLKTRAVVGGLTVVRLAARLYALGPASDIDLLVDRLDRLGRRALVGPGDALRELLALCPTGKYGRPAVRLAARLPGELRGRLGEALPAIGATDDLALAFAVADGFDLGAVLRMRSAADAQSGVERLRREVQAFVERPLLRQLGMAPLLAPLRTGRRDGDLHVAYRLPRGDAEALVERLTSLMRLTEGLLQRMQREPRSQDQEKQP